MTEEERKHVEGEAGMKSDIHHLKQDVSEIKGDIKEQGKKLDEMALNWQQFGGLSKLISDVASRTTKLESDGNLMKGGLLVVGALVVPLFINLVSSYFSK